MSLQRTFSGERLRLLRKAALLSRDVLAVSIGRTRDTIGNYERGFTTPDAGTLAALAERLDCNPNDFFEESGNAA